MTKSESKQVDMARSAIRMGEVGMAARTVSALYRAGSRKTQAELLSIAAELSLTGHPDFKI